MRFGLLELGNFRVMHPSQGLALLVLIFLYQPVCLWRWYRVDSAEPVGWGSDNAAVGVHAGGLGRDNGVDQEPAGPSILSNYCKELWLCTTIKIFFFSKKQLFSKSYLILQILAHC